MTAIVTPEGTLQHHRRTTLNSEQLMKAAAESIGLLDQGFTLESFKEDEHGAVAVYAHNRTRFIFSDSVHKFVECGNRYLMQNAKLIGPNRTLTVDNEVICCREVLL